GATGTSDKILMAMVREEVSTYRQTISRTITDPEALSKAVETYREELMKAYGLDKPWYTRIGDMLVRIALLDLGKSKGLQTFSGSNRVIDLIMERLPNTILLVTTATVLAFLIGLLVGVRLATAVGSRLDRALTYFSAVSYALPTWWTGIIFILIFYFYLRLFPAGGMYSVPPPEGELSKLLDLLWHAALPIAVLVLATVGSNIYVTRTVVINIAQEDYVTVARAKGLSERIVRWRYIARVAAPPILTQLILGLAGSIGGAILTETVFGWPGMGLLFYQAITSSDEALILGLVYVFTLVYVIARFVLEMLYVILDPRVRI
ncbi:MAG: ABC transporter permease, partial [Aigarchaeota archaeon]|nr:ABC transporter permease [Aigarchaeota archaeon]